MKRFHEISRIEAFSDAVFAFALTLLVVSLEVPATFEELMQTMRGFVAFACCFAIVVWIWYEHTAFFHRFPMHDPATAALNAALLFVVLFYVYPLKFVFTRFIGELMGQNTDGIVLQDVPKLMMIYSAGFVVLFGIFALLYRHAYRRRDALGLDELGAFDAKSGITTHLATASVGVFSILIALVVPARMVGFAGWIYMLLGPIHGLLGARHGNRRRQLEATVRARRVCQTQ